MSTAAFPGPCAWPGWSSGDADGVMFGGQSVMQDAACSMMQDAECRNGSTHASFLHSDILHPGFLQHSAASGAGLPMRRPLKRNPADLAANLAQHVVQVGAGGLELVRIDHQ